MTTPTQTQDGEPETHARASWTAPGSTFYALGSPAYRVLWLNASLMLTAMHLGFATHNVVAYDLTGNNSSVGVVSFGIGVAILISIPFSGAIADRVSKRLLLFMTQLLILLMAVMLSTLLLTDLLTIGLMIPAALMFGAGIAFFWPAITACMGETVEPDRQANGAALFQIALNLTRSFSPFVGAGLVAWQATSFTGAYLAVAVVMIATIATIAFIPKSRPADDGAAPAADPDAPPRLGMLDDVKSGLRYVFATRRLLEVLVSFIVIIMLGFSIMVVLPAYSKDVLGTGNEGFGIMFGTHAIGSLAAGLLVASKTHSADLKKYLFFSSFALGLTICVLALMPNFALGLVMVFFVGAAAGGFMTLVMGAIVRAAQPEYFGRVVALTSLGWALNNLVGLVLGVIADLSSERGALFGLGIVIAVVAIGLALWARTEDPPVVVPATA